MGTEQCAVVREVDCLGNCDEQTRSTLERRMGYMTDSTVVERSDGCKLGSAFFVIRPFRYNVFVGV